MYRYKGAITVFLSLVSILFLSLFCTMIESARVQCARFQAAAAFDMGLFSVFGEYDRVLLEEYDLWFLDGSCGQSEFSQEGMKQRLQGYISLNLNPSKELAAGKSWNPFPSCVDVCEVNKYALATDEDGGVFFDQAVESEKEMLTANLAAEVRKIAKDMEQQEGQAKQYQEKERISEQDLLKAQEAQKEMEKEPEQEEKPEEQPEKQTVANPLDTIKRIKELGILGLVMKDPSSVSQRILPIQDPPSRRVLNEGTWQMEQKHSKVSAQALFLSYLKHHFSCAAGTKGERAMAYELEYLAAGKKSDQENLKQVVNKLLLLREGVNYACLLKSPVKSKEAFALASAIAGITAIPALVTALQQALLLAWAYGESLLEVRTLLSGGKVPLLKEESHWRLSLSNLANLTEELNTCDGGGEGQTYGEYLLGILALTKQRKKNMRALDLIEANRRTKKGGENFRADALVAGIQAEADIELEPIFLKVPAAFMGIRTQGTDCRIEGKYSYMEGGG